MILYLIKSAICLSVTWVLYKLFLSNKKSFIFNRGFLLLGMIGSSIFPLIQLYKSSKIIQPIEPILIDFINTPTVLMTERALTKQVEIINEGIILSSLFYWVYMLVCCVFGIRILFHIIKIISYAFGKQSYIKDGMKVILADDKNTPFSFFNKLFVSKTDYNNGVPMSIFHHEQCHAHQLHTLDRIVSEAILVLHWWNPFAHLMTKSIRDNHEYIADQYAMNMTGQNEQYIQQLLSRSLPKKTDLMLKTGFAQSSLLKRLVMIQTTNSKPNHFSQIFLSLVLVTTFIACTEQADSFEITELQEVETTIVTDELTGYDYVYPTSLLKKLKSFGIESTGGMLEYKILSSDLFEKFKDENNFELRIDNQKVSNSVLLNYTNEDFRGYRVLAPTPGEVKFQAFIYTPKGYEEKGEIYIKNMRTFMDDQNSGKLFLRIDRKSTGKIVQKRPSAEFFLSLCDPDKYLVYIGHELVDNASLLNRSPNEFSYYTELNNEVRLMTNERFETFKKEIQEKYKTEDEGTSY